jgi:MFS family permease
LSAPRPYRALRHRDYRRLLFAQLVSITGTQMQVVAVNWHIYLLTRSALALGFVGLTRVLPLIVFSLWGGIVADREDRKRVMFFAQSLMALCAGALGLLTLLHRETVFSIYAFTALAAAASAFDQPARQALIPRLVPLEDLPGALSLNLTAFQVGLIGGPGLAGLLIAEVKGGASAPAALHAVPSVGLAGIYALNMLSFGGVLLSLWRMEASGEAPKDGGEPEGALASLRAGLHFVFTTPIMVWTMALDFFATFFAGSMSLLPIFADQVIKVGPAGYGWLVAAPALGAAAGSVYAALRPLPERQGPLLLLAIAGYGIMTIVYGLSSSFSVMLLALAGTGLADLVSTVIRQTLRQFITPDSLRGRMTSVNMIFFTGGPQLGELEAGFVASLFASQVVGVRVSVVSGGIATLLTVLLVATLTPVVRQYVRRPLPAATPS